MTTTLEFWFDFASTYSYPAAMRIETLAQTAGLQVAWKPFLLGVIFKQQGWDSSPFNLYPAMGRYMWRDWERTCQALNLPYIQPSQFPRQSLLAARIACRSADEVWIADFIKAVFQANFVHDQDIADPLILSAYLDSLGLDGQALLQQAQTSTSKALLRQQTEQAVAKGIIGAPTVMVGEEMFWGNDRLEQAIAWAS